MTGGRRKPVKEYQDGGSAALIHKARGRTASYRINVDIRDYALELVSSKERMFSPTFSIITTTRTNLFWIKLGCHHRPTAALSTMAGAWR